MRCQCPHYTETANGWCCPEVMRKISGGSQSEDGLLTREVLTSVWLTLRLRHGQDQAHVLFVSALLFPSAASPPNANP